ncbi:MAG: formate/nitrite transporter family protein [Clostridia bacterium]|nr:formate/nitrite transporter family protein [Clostridia bacterium]
MKFLRTLVSALLGGIAVGLSCTAYLLLKGDSPFGAAMVFAMGFLAVGVLDFSLFTDKSGNLFTTGNIEKNISKLLTTLLGNITGVVVCALSVRSQLYSVSNDLAQATISGSYFELFLNSVLCGMLVYIALHSFRVAGGFTGSTTLILASISLTLLSSGYSLFNVFILANGVTSFTTFTGNLYKIIVVVFLTAIGNVTGAVIFSLLSKFKDGTDDERHNDHQLKHHH